MSFTIRNVLIAIEDAYTTVDVKVVDDKLLRSPPDLDVVGTAV